MRLPVVKGVIQRRLLVNFRVEPTALAGLLPAPFEPLLVRGHAIAGICLIRLGAIRPRFIPSACGVHSENAAHRIAVRWTDKGFERQGVYIPRRDSSSRLNAMIGGRLFPGVHHRADFRVLEDADTYEVEMRSKDGSTSLAVRGRVTSGLPASSAFGDLNEASDFFRGGSLGYSATARQDTYDGLELRCWNWEVQPLAVESVQSSFFGNPRVFPPGSVEFDCALLMRNVAHEWHAADQLCCSEPASALA